MSNEDYDEHGNPLSFNYDYELGAQRVKVELFTQGVVWVDKNQKVWLVSELTDSHLKRLIDWLDRYWDGYIMRRYLEKYGAHRKDVAEWRHSALGRALVREEKKRQVQPTAESIIEKALEGYVSPGSARSISRGVVRELKRLGKM